MAIKSLNEAYENGTLVYLCNACGDVSDPDNTERILTMEDEIRSVLTLRECVLYENYWTNDSGCSRYVLRVYVPDKNAVPTAAIGLCFLFDKNWCRDIVRAMFGEEPDDMKLIALYMPRLFLALSDAAKIVFKPLVPDCDLYLGNNTDPDGHELLVVVPYAMRDKIDTIVGELSPLVYDTVEEIF